MVKKLAVLLGTIACLTLPVAHCDVKPPVINTGILNQNMTLGDCQACKIFIESFQKGLERTARGKYEGGDAAWEEEKLKKSYKRSEMRLIDIQESICKEDKKHSAQCHHMAEKAEEFIEEWWAQNPDESDDLYTYICIEKMQVCCPKHHYGKECTPCPEQNGKICNGNGKCRGDGTRKGNGLCLCDKGFAGENCDTCAIGYYVMYIDDNKMVCGECNKVCMGGCRGGTNKDCVACSPGYSFESDEGCMDINECDDIHKCKKDEFCMNSLGSYVCSKCDRACESCHGAGADECRKCAEEYTRVGDFCVRDREDDSDPKLSNARYLTYVGLLIATGILLPKSTSLGGLVGALVLSYIIGAEYYCMINGHTGLINLKEYDLTRVFHT